MFIIMPKKEKIIIIKQLKRALVHQLQLIVREMELSPSPITHDAFENDDVTNDSDLFDVDDNPNTININNKNINIKIFYIKICFFDIKDFEMSKESFLDWYEPLRRYFIANDLNTFIDKQTDIENYE